MSVRPPHCCAFWLWLTCASCLAARSNRFTPFLAIDPVVDPSPGERDPEECCLTFHRVPLSRLDELLFGDDVLLPSLATAQLAMRELRKRGLLPQS